MDSEDEFFYETVFDVMNLCIKMKNADEIPPKISGVHG